MNPNLQSSEFVLAVTFMVGIFILTAFQINMPEIYFNALFYVVIGYGGWRQWDKYKRGEGAK